MSGPHHFSAYRPLDAIFGKEKEKDLYTREEKAPEDGKVS